MDGPGKARKIDALGLHNRIDCTMQGDDCEDCKRDCKTDCTLHIGWAGASSLHIKNSQLVLCMEERSAYGVSCLWMDESLAIILFSNCRLQKHHQTLHCTVFSILCVDRIKYWNEPHDVIKHSCPSGLRGSTQVRVYSYSWVQIPQNASLLHSLSFLLSSLLLPFGLWPLARGMVVYTYSFTSKVHQYK